MNALILVALNAGCVSRPFRNDLQSERALEHAMAATPAEAPDASARRIARLERRAAVRGR